jgi:hypothetical protein
MNQTTGGALSQDFSARGGVHGSGLLQRTTRRAGKGQARTAAQLAAGNCGPNIADHSTAATIAVTQRRSAQA